MNGMAISRHVPPACTGTSCATTIDSLIFYIKRIFNGIPPDIIHHPDFTLVETILGTASHAHRAPASIIHHRGLTLDCTRTSLSRLILHCLESIARIGRVPVQEKLRKSRFSSSWLARMAIFGESRAAIFVELVGGNGKIWRITCRDFRRVGWREWQYLANHVPRFDGVTNASRRLTSEWLQVREIDTRASNQKHHAEMPSKSMQFHARTFSTKRTGSAFTGNGMIGERPEI